MALVEIENISKFYQTGEVQVKALSDVNLSIDEASFVSFVDNYFESYRLP